MVVVCLLSLHSFEPWQLFLVLLRLEGIHSVSAGFTHEFCNIVSHFQLCCGLLSSTFCPLMKS